MKSLLLNKTLEELSLNQSYTKIDLTELLNALKVNRTLKKISLKSIKIDEKTAKDIVEMLKVNKTLEVLNLQNSMINDKSLMMLIESFKINSLKHMGTEFISKTNFTEMIEKIEKDKN